MPGPSSPHGENVTDTEPLTRLKEEILLCERLPPEEREARLNRLGRTAPEPERGLRSLLEHAPIDDAQEPPRVLDSGCPT